MTIPDQYKDTITRFLAQYGEWLEYQLQALEPAHDLAETGLARQLAFIAQAAAGDLQHYAGDDEDPLEEQILSDVADLLARLYHVPGIGTTDDVDVPAAFWDHPLGQMCARALLWALEGKLITLQEAADTAWVTVQAVSQAVATGRLAGYIDPDATQRQGRTLVKRTDVLAIEWKRSSAFDPANRYRRQDKRAAYEAALEFVLDNILGPHIFPQLVEMLQEEHGLSEADARDVAAKAISVEHGRRRQKAIEEKEADAQ
jgi:hypothetical protein